MRNVTLPTMRCYRCVHTWIPVKSPVRICPRCKSRLWDVPKVRPVRLGRGLGVAEIIAPHRSELLRLAHRFGVKRIRVFGSVRRREANGKSDVDLLVDWRRGSRLLDTVAFRLEAEKLLGRRVEAIEASRLHWAIRPRVMSEAVPL